VHEQRRVDWGQARPHRRIAVGDIASAPLDSIVSRTLVNSHGGT
jgi:hypothetical protein